MESPRMLYARDLEELHEECVACNSDEQLACPSCPSGESCRFNIPTDCTQCPQAECRPSETVPADETETSSTPSNDGGGGTNVGAIVGGVIGGIVVIVIVAYLAWRFLIKPKRGAESSHYSAYIVEADASQGMEKDGQSQLTRRSSTHTVHSIASTVLTRASNIIQIAYIPGVTNRANPSEPGVLVPPVPPIPMQHSGSIRESTNDDPHFFVPGDLRDSTYSGFSGYSDRTSVARTSYAPRSSVASTIYGKQAQVMTGMQTGMRAKPTMVSVKSYGPGGNTPPVPTINVERFGGNARPKSGASTFSVGSTFLNTATQARAHGAQVVKVGSGLKTIDLGNRSDVSSLSTRSTEDMTPGLESVADSATMTLVNDITPPPAAKTDQGPFADPPSIPSTPRVAEPPKLGSVMEGDPAEEQRAIAELSGSEPVVRRGASPFGDEHATK